MQERVAMEADYKRQDTEKIIRYISLFPDGVEVEDVRCNSGADKLRVYPALFELEQDGSLEVLEREFLGAPKRVRWKKLFFTNN